MLSWVTVWVLTVTSVSESYKVKSHYQLTYATQELCLKQIKAHTSNSKTAQCNFSQIPVYK